MRRKVAAKLLCLSIVVLLASCDSDERNKTPTVVLDNYRLSVSEINVTRASDGATVDVSGLPLSSNITVVVDH